MKEKVAKFLNDNEKELWYEIYEAFQKSGLKEVDELIRKKADDIKEKFDELKEIINKKVGGTL